ncbi:MAG: hypothetical protein ACKO0M_01825 [Cyanobium sp.]
MTSRRGNPRSARRRVLVALILGALTGLAAALLLRAAIQRTAAPLSPERAFWQLVLMGVSGGLAGFALSAVSALQAANPDPEAHLPHRRLRPADRPGSGRSPGDRA